MCDDTKEKLFNFDERVRWILVLQQSDNADIVILLLRTWLIRPLPYT